LSDILLHLLVPAITLLALYDHAQIKWIISLLPFAVLPDIDHIDALYTLNRALLHNVFCLIPLILIALYSIKNKNNTMKHFGILATFFWSSHILLDLDGVQALWPLSGNRFILNANLIPIGNLLSATNQVSMEYLLVFLLGLLISIPNVRRNHLMFLKKGFGKSSPLIFGETTITPSSTQNRRE